MPTRSASFLRAPTPTSQTPGSNVHLAVHQVSPSLCSRSFRIDPAFTPIYVVGIASAPRVYAISQRVGGGHGQVSTIETTSNTIDPNPIHRGHESRLRRHERRRQARLHHEPGQTALSASSTPRPTSSTSSPPEPPTRSPSAPHPSGQTSRPRATRWSSPTPATASTPVRSASSVFRSAQPTALPTNPNCDPNNPVDAVGFGTVLATVPVGINPVMVGVLQDGTRAYVVNGGNPNLPCAAPTPALPLGNCTVSVINLTTNTVTATIPSPIRPASARPYLNGHPNYIAVTTGTPTGKVYVTSPESNFMTVIRTDTDTVDLTVPLQGNGVSVRVTAALSVNRQSYQHKTKSHPQQDGSLFVSAPATLLPDQNDRQSRRRRSALILDCHAEGLRLHALRQRRHDHAGIAAPIRMECPCRNRISPVRSRNQPKLIGLRRLQRLQIARQKDQRALARNIRCPALRKRSSSCPSSASPASPSCPSSYPAPAAPPRIRRQLVHCARLRRHRAAHASRWHRAGDTASPPSPPVQPPPPSRSMATPCPPRCASVRSSSVR